MKKFKVKKILVLGYNKRNDYKISRPSAKLIASDSDIDKAFKSMHQSIMKKNYTGENWNVLDVIIMHSIKIFEC